MDLYLYDLELGNSFLNMMPQIKARKKYKVDFIKVKPFASKDTIK